jgi:non-heme chloroperoxidase
MRQPTGFAILACTALLWPGESRAQSDCPPLTGRNVAVSPTVSVHVVEWGGSGPPVVFLSGLSGTPYSFDEFAPLFADRWRVIGIGRRGILPSTPDSSDLTAGRLVSDVAAILDSFSIDAVHVVGSSFGGDEATLLAAWHPQRVLSLTLLDSYDNAPETGTFAELDSLKWPTVPVMREDSLSLRSLQVAVQAGRGPFPARHPMTAICAQHRFDSAGRWLGRATPGAILGKLVSGMVPMPYSSIRHPALAVFRLSRDVYDEHPMHALDVEDQELARMAFLVWMRASRAARDRFRHEVPHARIVEIAGARHSVHLSHPERTYLAMRAFFQQVDSGEAAWR